MEALLLRSSPNSYQIVNFWNRRPRNAKLEDVSWKLIGYTSMDSQSAISKAWPPPAAAALVQGAVGTEAVLPILYVAGTR